MKRKAQKCPAEMTLDIIGGRWKVLILWQLFQGERRFLELFRELHGITQKRLTQQLRETRKSWHCAASGLCADPSQGRILLNAIG